MAHLDQTQSNSTAPFYFKQEARQSDEAILPGAVSQETAPQQLTHLDSHGRAHMVDVGQVCTLHMHCTGSKSHPDGMYHNYLILQKNASVRNATASAIVQLNSSAFRAIAADGRVAKGDALTVAQLAGLHITHSPCTYLQTCCLALSVTILIFFCLGICDIQLCLVKL